MSVEDRLRQLEVEVLELRGQLSEGLIKPAHSGNLLLEGIFDAQLVQGDSTGVNFSVWGYDHTTTFVDLGYNVTARFPSGKGATIPANKWGVIAPINGEWRPIASEC
jgi:hypothetical protein